MGRARGDRYKPVLRRIFLSRAAGGGGGKGRRLPAREATDSCIPCCDPRMVPPATSSQLPPIMSSEEDDAPPRQRVVSLQAPPRGCLAKFRLLIFAVMTDVRGLSVSSAERRVTFALTMPPVVDLPELGFLIERMLRRFCVRDFGLGSLSARYRVREDVDLTATGAPCFTDTFIVMMS